MYVIVVNSLKGGTGKTTLTLLLSTLLAWMYQLRVLMVDMDPQGCLSESFNLDPKDGIFETVARGKNVVDWLDFPDPARYCPIGQQPKGELMLLPGANLTFALGTKAIVPNAGRLREVLEDIEHAVDLVIIDTNPTAGELLPFSYSAADAVLVPTMLERLSITGMMKTIETAETIGVPLFGIVPNMFKDTSLHNKNLEDVNALAAANNWRVLPKLTDYIAWAEASQEGQMLQSLRGAGKARIESIALAKAVYEALPTEVR